MTNGVQPRLLALVVASQGSVSLDAIEHALTERAGADEVRCLHDGAWIMHVAAQAPDVRDWLRPLLRDGESVFVAEFERWSGYGAGLHARWLLRRGH